MLANNVLKIPGPLNRDRDTVVNYAKIASRNATLSIIFLTGTLSAVDSYRQFITPCDSIFNTLDRQSPETDTGKRNLAKVILGQNPVVQKCVLDQRSNTVKKLPCKLIGSADTAMNLVIMNADGLSAQSAEWEILRAISELFFDRLYLEILSKEFRD
jgi:hypothetical protein